METLRVGVTPWVHMRPECLNVADRHPSTSCKAGIELEILSTLASIANVRLSLLIANGTGCGKTPLEDGSNGSWTGLFEWLRDGKIDVIGNFCDAKKLARLDQDFFRTSWPVWQYKEQFVVRTPAPAALSFAPFAPFSRHVWLGCGIMYAAFISFVTFYYYLEFGAHDSSDDSSSPRRVLLGQVLRAESVLRGTMCGYVRHVPPQFVWLLWFFLITLMFMAYNVYILSAVLRPFPVWRPFSNTDQLVDRLVSGRYRYLSHKYPPPVPTACANKPSCERRFDAAIRQHGYEYVPGGSGYQLLAKLASSGARTVGQSHGEDNRLVLVQGEPYLQLYLSEYKEDRSRFWIIDDEQSLEKWSTYVWRTNLSQSKLFDSQLMVIGEYKTYALSRSLQLHGTPPHRGDRFVKGGSTNEDERDRRAIDIRRFSGLLYVYLIGAGASTIVFLLENTYARFGRMKTAF